MSADQQEEHTSRSGPVLAVLAVVIVVVLIAVWLNRDGDDEPQSAATPDPTPSETAEPTETAEATEPPSPEPTQAESPEPDEPTEQDVAAFAEAHGPADHTATGDIDGDGVDEVVIARVRSETTHIVVGRWNGASYEEIFADDGGSADRVDGLDLQDYNGEPGVEIVTLESVGESGASLSVWGAAGEGVQRQVAEGGCWDGFHHYGISGATIEPGEIVATCDGSPLPPEAWTSDVYEWSDGAWTYVRTEEPEV